MIFVDTPSNDGLGNCGHYRRRSRRRRSYYERVVDAWGPCARPLTPVVSNGVAGLGQTVIVPSTAAPSLLPAIGLLALGWLIWKGSQPRRA